MYSGTPSAPAPVTRNHGHKSEEQQQTRSIQRLAERESVRLHGFGPPPAPPPPNHHHHHHHQPHTADGSAPLGLQRKARHQTQARQQMRSPAVSTTRSATFPLSQRTRKKPRMTSTPHRLYIRLLASSPKPKKRCVMGVTMVWCRGRAASPPRWAQRSNTQNSSGFLQTVMELKRKVAHFQLMHFETL